MAASPNIVSSGNAMIFTQSEATAAQATWVFYLSTTADGTAATGLSLAASDVKISKAGGAFGNATGTPTELSLGWYKFVFAAGDLDTLGALAVHITHTGVDSLHVVHQVTALDLNVATVQVGSIAANAITAASIASDADTEFQAGLSTAAAVAALASKQRTDNRTGSITTATGSAATSMLNAIDCVVQTTGTYGGGTITVETCEDPTAVSPVWTTTGHTSTSNDSYTVAGPHAAVRAKMAGATSPAVAVVFLVRYAA